MFSCFSCCTSSSTVVTPIDPPLSSSRNIEKSNNQSSQNTQAGYSRNPTVSVQPSITGRVIQTPSSSTSTIQTTAQTQAIGTAILPTSQNVTLDITLGFPTLPTYSLTSHQAKTTVTNSKPLIESELSISLNQLPSDPLGLISFDDEISVALRSSIKVSSECHLKAIKIRFNRNISKVRDIFIALIRQREIADKKETLFSAAFMRFYVRCPKYPNGKKGSTYQNYTASDSIYTIFNTMDPNAINPYFCCVSPIMLDYSRLFSINKFEKIKRLLKDSDTILNALIRGESVKETVIEIEEIEKSLDSIQTDDIVPYQKLMALPYTPGPGNESPISGRIDLLKPYTDLENLSDNVRWMSASLCDYRNAARIRETFIQIFNKKAAFNPDLVQIISDYMNIRWSPIKGAKSLCDGETLEALGPTEATIIHSYTTIEGISMTNKQREELETLINTNKARIEATIKQILDRKTNLPNVCCQIISSYMNWPCFERLQIANPHKLWNKLFMLYPPTKEDGINAKPLYDDITLEASGPTEMAIIHAYNTIEILETIRKEKLETSTSNSMSTIDILKTFPAKKFLESNFLIPYSKEISIKELHRLMPEYGR